MKIIEVRDGFINFEADERVYLSSFVQADGIDKSYVAQVNRLKKIGNVCIASAKILFLLIGEELNNYDKTLPSKDAELKLFPFSVLQNLISTKSPVIVGKLLDNSQNVVIDSEVFNKKMLISSDNQDFHNLLINNLSKQFKNLNKSTLVLDTLGIIKSKKYTAGSDFKLPLDTESLKFLYKSCLNDATSDSKATIVEIFKDLSEYSESVPFVPFETLKSIVDDMVDNQHVFKLFVLKNKLAKLQKTGYFATKTSEVDAINKILASESAIIDFSKLDTLFLNQYLDYVYKAIEKKENTQIFLELSNSVSKKNLKHIFLDSKVNTTPLVHSKYQYLNDIKNMFDNFIIEPTAANKTAFKAYDSFMDSMPNNTYLIIGEGLNYIPVISAMQKIEDIVPYTSKKNDSIEETISDEQVVSAEDLEYNGKIEENISEHTEESSEVKEEDFIQRDNQIISNIEEKTDTVINSISTEIDKEQGEIDLFEDDLDDNDEEITDSEENLESVEEETDTEDVIEPEYSEAEMPEEDEEDEYNDEYEELNESDSEIELSSDDSELNLADEGLDVVSHENETELSDSDSLELETKEDEKQELLQDDTEAQLVTEPLQEETSDDELTIPLDSDEENLIQDLEVTNIEQENSIIDSTAEFTSEEPEILGIGDDDDSTLEEIVELNPEDTDENDIIIDISDEADNINIDEDTDRQIVEDVDKVFTTMKEPETLEEISDSDLDLIDELNNSEEEPLEEYKGEELEEVSDSGFEDGILEQPQESIIPERLQSDNDTNSEILEKREANTPIVPVYDADIPQEDMVISDPIQQGDSVIHAKYGNGVVEKMIKYGTKTLFSINFENIGRRLLDPTLTEIKKL